MKAQSEHWTGSIDLSGGKGGPLFDKIPSSIHNLQSAQVGGNGQDGTSH
jgi:hypothetical protein